MVLPASRTTSMNKLFNNIAKAWKAFVAHKKVLPLVVLVDLLFIYGLTRLHYEIFNRASTYAIKLTAMMGRQVQELTESEAMQEFAMLQSPEFAAAYQALLKYIAIFFFGALIIWLSGKGIVWLAAHKAADKKTNVRDYALRFTGMTLFWFAAFIALTLATLVLLDYALFGVFPLIGKIGANAAAVLFYWILAYFVFISYSIVPKPAFKSTFVLGVTRWKELLPVHIIGSLVFFVATTVPSSLVKLNIYLSLAFIVLIALPMMAFMRVLWITTVQKVMNYA